MAMATLQFYQNKYRYPRYSDTITRYGSSMSCTPVGMNLRSGSIRVEGDFSDFMACNYLALTRDGKTIYAWIDDVKFINDRVFEVAYSVDAWRTYKSKISLGTQFIKRSPNETFLKDPLLGSTRPYKNIDSTLYMQPWATSRIMVVQVRAGSGEIFSNTPVQPTPYQFFLIRYDVDDWKATQPLDSLMTYLSQSAETQNIVTMYSIPYMNIDSIPTAPLIVKTASETFTVNGFKMITDEDTASLLYLETPISLGNTDNLFRIDHSVSIVIPEAGIINIPDELLIRTDLKLRQDIDLFSGASNYMLISGAGKYYDLSVRGSSISSIPIISDPLDTYLSQNQNALATSLIGDVASIAMGAGIIAGTGGVGAALGGSASIAGGVNGLMNTAANIGDAGNSYANPPAFLGTALANNFNQCFWVVTRQTIVENEGAVHSNYGYPQNIVAPLTFPAAGYIQTESCNVYSDGSVPKWALDEINANFNNGILVL